MLRIILLLVTALYAVYSLIDAAAALKQHFTKTALLTLIASVCLLFAPLIRETVTATSSVTLALVIIASCKLYAYLRNPEQQHLWPQLLRLLLTLAIAAGFHFLRH